MKSDTTPNWTRWLLPAGVIVLLDQLTKLWIVRVFEHGESARVTDFFDLVLAHNTGAAFSMLHDAGGWQRVFFSVVATVASVVIVYLLRKHRDEYWFCAGLSLILGGALGNLIDRLRFGYVVDFLHFHWREWSWPAFNVADSAITVGAALLIWDSFRRKTPAADVSS